MPDRFVQGDAFQDDAFQTEAVTVASAGNPLVVSPLETGKRYKLQARVRTAAGWQPWSALTASSYTPRVQAALPQSVNNVAWTEGRPPYNWRAYADSSPLNTPIEAAPLHPNSQAIIDYIARTGQQPATGFSRMVTNTGGTRYDYGRPVYRATAADPLHTLQHTDSVPASNTGPAITGVSQIRVPNGAKQAGDGTRFVMSDGSDRDGHASFVLLPDGTETNLWQASTPVVGGGTLQYAGGGRGSIFGDGVDDQGGSTAGNLGGFAGALRWEELNGPGEIEHAAFAITPYVTGFVAPALKTGRLATDANKANAPRMGERLRLKMTVAQIDALAEPDWAKKILRMLRRYGLVIGDTGGSGIGLGIQAESGMVYRSFNGNTDEPWIALTGARVSRYADPDIGGRTTVTLRLDLLLTVDSFEVVQGPG